MTGFVSRYSKLIHILAAILIASMLFIAVQPGIVRAFASEETLSLAVAANGVPVGTEVDEDGFRQITYKFSGREVEITDSDYTNSDPETDGEYITWMAQIDGSWQVFLHHVTTGSTVQLTQVGNNVNPVISGKNVAWEGQVDGVWQGFVFDGVRIIQITDGKFPSLNVDIDGNVVVYSTKESAETGWRIYMYDISTGAETLLTPNSYGSEPFLDDGRVKWTELVDKSPVRRYFQYKEVVSTGTPVGLPSEEVAEDFTGVGDTIPEDELLVEETTESVEIIDENVGEAPEVPEATVSEELEEVLGTEDADEPEEVTVADIKEELGIPDEDGVEEGAEQETNPEVIIEEDEVSESTASS